MAIESNLSLEQKATPDSTVARWLKNLFRGNKITEKPFDPSRRAFLRKMGIAAGAVALAATIPEAARGADPKPIEPPTTAESTTEVVASPETGHTTSNQLFLDFTPMTEYDQQMATESPMQAAEFSSIDEVTERIRSDWERDNPGAPLPPEELNRYVAAMLRKFSDHGRKMIQTAADIKAATHGESISQERQEEYAVIPLQSMLEFAGPYVPKQPPEAGVTKETGYYLRLAPEKLIEALKNRPETVINLSFQVGTFGLLEKQREKVSEVVDTDVALKFQSYEASPTENRFFAIDPSLEQRDEVEGYNESGELVKHTQFINGDWYNFVHDEAASTTQILNAQTGEPLPTYSQAEMEILKRENEKQSMKSVTETRTDQEVLSAYTGEYAEQNLRDLYSVAQAYPEKIFFASLGNSGEDISAIVEKLTAEGVKPPNLFIVGESKEYTTELGALAVRPALGSAGADVFVTNKTNSVSDHREPMESGSSFSTTFLSSVAEHYLNRPAGGLNQAEIAETLRTLSKNVVDESSGKSFTLFDEKEFWQQVTMRNAALG